MWRIPGQVAGSGDVQASTQRQLLRADLALRTAEDMADTRGAMKGVMMKLGQIASYVDDGLAPAVRRSLARLQDSAPPIRPELAAAAVEEELGARRNEHAPAGIRSP